MSEDLNVFPNSKAPLFGLGEDSIGEIDTAAVAGLAGSLTLNASSVVDSASSSGPNGVVVDRSNPSIISIPMMSISMGALVTGDKVAIVYAGINPPAVDLVRNGSVIAFFSAQNDGNEFGFTVFIDTIPSDNTYTYELETNPNFTVISSRLFVGFRLDATDSHAGFISQVATAKKTIITPDSHFSRELAVLPG